MFANKLGFIAIAFVAEVCAAGGPNFLTLCIHEDGSARYEPTMALCCKQDGQGHGECCSHQEGKPFESEGITPKDPCQDYGVVFTQVPTPAPSIKQILTDNLGLCEFLPVVILNPEAPIFESSIAFGCCGPPGNHTLLDLSTVVLRI